MYIWNQDYYFPVVFGLCCEKLLASTVNTWSFTTSSSSNHSVKETTAMTVLSPSLVQSHPSLLLWQPDTLWHKGILPERGLWEIHFVKVSFASNIQPQQYVRTQEERTARDTDDTFSWRILRWGWGGSVSMVLYCTIEKCVSLCVCAWMINQLLYTFNLLSGSSHLKCLLCAQKFEWQLSHLSCPVKKGQLYLSYCVATIVCWIEQFYIFCECEEAEIQTITYISSTASSGTFIQYFN